MTLDTKREPDAVAFIQSTTHTSGRGFIPVRRAYGGSKDLSNLLLHGYTVLRRSAAQPLVDVLVDSANAQSTLAALLKADAGAEYRQVGLLDHHGNCAAHTGSLCIREASHACDAFVSAQANMMVHSGVPEAMKTAFDQEAGPLAERLVAALRAAEALYWHGIAMLNSGRGEEALDLLRPLFERNPAWLELTMRLPASRLAAFDAHTETMLRKWSTEQGFVTRSW